MNQSVESWNTDFVECSTAKLGLPYFKYVGPLKQSPTDQRHHQLIRLPNNMVVVCTSDKDATMAAASLSVNVGSFIDPPELQGLAHFLEHMLFMGSEKYPDEDEYVSYIDHNMGSYNGLTYQDKTTYYFTVANNALEGGLDRLAQFFISPLFIPDCVDRELHNVDSEFKGELLDNDRRFYQLESHLMDSAHPHSMFSTGNLDTLKGSAEQHGLNLRDEMIKLYNKYYSADIMKLAVIGNQSLDQLVEWVVAKFSSIESKGTTMLKRLDQPLTADLLGKVIHFESVGGCNEINVVFALPETKQFYKTNSEYYIKRLINHDGQHSLLKYMKQKGWVIDIDAFNTEYTGYSLFYICFICTSSGIECYEDVINALFAYIKMLNHHGPQEWFYNELSAMQQAKFKYYEKPDELSWVEELTFNRHNSCIVQDYLIANDMLQEFDAVAISELLSHISPQNYRVFVEAPCHGEVLLTEREKIYGINYHISDILPQLVPDNNNYDFALPDKNTYVPNNLQVVTKQCSSPKLAPELLFRTHKSELWFKQDDQFQTPQGSIKLQLLLPNKDRQTVLEMITIRIATFILKEVLSNEITTGKNAGIGCELDYKIGSFTINVDGFSEPLSKFLENILHTCKMLQVKQNTFDMAIIEVIQELQAYYNSEPYEQHEYYTWWSINTNQYWPVETRELAIAHVNQNMVQCAISDLFFQCYSKLLICGNFTEARAQNVAQMVESVLDFKHMPNYLHTPRGLFHIDPGHFVYHSQAKLNSELNSCFASTLYCGLCTDTKEAVAIGLISQMISSPLFNQIRSKEKLGYTVYSYYNNPFFSRMVIRAVIQSEANPIYLSQRFDCFIRNFRLAIANFSDDELNTLIESAIAQKQSKLKTISEEADSYWEQIEFNVYNFDRREQEISYLKEITREYLLEMWDKYINPATSPNYTRVDLCLWSTKLNYPSTFDLTTTSEAVIALHGCLHSEGHTQFSLEEVNQLVKDGNAEAFSNIYLVEDTRVNTALEFALSHQTKVATDNLYPQMQQTADGKCIIHDIDQFKATLDIVKPIPDKPLIPKYV